MRTIKDELVNNVLEDQKDAIAVGDFTVLDELLHHVPDEILINSLSEVNDESVTKQDS